MKTNKPSTTTASVAAGRMNSNQIINNSFGGMSATTGTTTSNTFDHRTFIRIVYGGRFQKKKYDLNNQHENLITWH